MLNCAFVESNESRYLRFSDEQRQRCIDISKISAFFEDRIRGGSIVLLAAEDEGTERLRVEIPYGDMLEMLSEEELFEVLTDGDEDYGHETVQKWGVLASAILDYKEADSGNGVILSIRTANVFEGESRQLSLYQPSQELMGFLSENFDSMSDDYGWHERLAL